MSSLKSSRAIPAAVFVLLSCLSSSPAMMAQMRHTAAAKDLNYHVYAVVPLTGSGTAADPKRPMFVPAQGFKPVVPVVAAGRVTAVRTGILGYHAQISDDGKYALSGIHRRFEGGLERDPDDKRFESDHFSEGRTRQEPD